MFWHRDQETWERYRAIRVALASIANEKDVYDTFIMIYSKADGVPYHVIKGLRRRLENISQGTFERTLNQILMDF